MMDLRPVVVGLSCAMLMACGAQNTNNDNPASGVEAWPVVHSSVAKNAEQEGKVEALLETMTLEEKVGQIIQPEIRSITPQQVTQYHIGSILNGGGAFPNNNKFSTSADWLALADDYYAASIKVEAGRPVIPLLWGTDAVHGHNNVVGATLFPHNIGLGATDNPELMQAIAAATAKEVAVTGIDWIFAPTVAVVRDDRWGRTYEGYAETPERVKAYAGKLVEGIQGRAGDEDFLRAGHLLATAKHFVGDGGTQKGVDQGNNLATERELIELHAQGYVAAIEAGVQTIMASFNSWQGNKIHGSEYLLTHVLKERMGFDGFVVGDWNGHGQVQGCSNVRCPQAINAGVDMIMVPDDWQQLYVNTLADVRAGTIPMARLDDAVRRILRVKYRAGLFDDVGKPSSREFAGADQWLGHPSHRAVAQQAVRESLVLLKNNDGILPLKPQQRVLVAGDGANNIGKQSGGWTLSWQGTGNVNTDFPGGTSIYDGIAQQVSLAGGSAILSEDGSFTEAPDVAIVVFGEDPYAEGQGDIQTLEYQAGFHRDLKSLKKLKAQGVPVVSIFLTGRPLWVNAELNASDAFVVAWLPGSEGGAVAEVLFTDAQGEVQSDFIGRLTYSWPLHEQQVVNANDNEQPLFSYGYGANYRSTTALAEFDLDSLPETLQKSLPLSELKAMDLFAGRSIAPWQLSLFDQAGVHAINTSVMNLESIKISTADRRVQEDARSIRWENADTAGVILGSVDRHNIAQYLSAEGALEFDLLLGQSLAAELQAGMQCGGSCAHFLTLTDAVSKLALDQWHTVSIDLRCFAEAGVDFNHIQAPFVLQASGNATLSISDIRLVPQTGDNATIQCGAHS